MAITERQFNRCIELTFIRDDGRAIQIPEIGGTVEPCLYFDVELSRIAEPNWNSFEIYNLDEEQRQYFRLGEFTRLQLRAGHKNANNVAIIFEGRVRRELADDPASDDIVTIVHAREGEFMWRRGLVTHTFPAGTTPLEMVRYMLANHMPDINEGDLSGISGKPPYRRPYVVNGKIRSFFHDIARDHNTRWSIQRTSLDFVSNDTASDTFRVNKKTCDTGLIKADLDEGAIVARTVLDPAIRPNAVVEVEHDRPGTSGFWRIDTVRHFGGTANLTNEFYSDFSGQRIEGVRRVSGQTERTIFRG